MALIERHGDMEIVAEASNAAEAVTKCLAFKPDVVVMDIRLTGTSGNGIILGFMLATALISMWISNTATAIMMLPIASSVTSLLARDLGMTAVAEGIEQQADWDLLDSLGCDVAQGYYVARPMSEQGLEQWLPQWTARHG